MVRLGKSLVGFETRDEPVVREGLPKHLSQGLEAEAEGFARARDKVDYDIGMKNFIHNGPRVTAVFLHE